MVGNQTKRLDWSTGTISLKLGFSPKYFGREWLLYIKGKLALEKCVNGYLDGFVGLNCSAAHCFFLHFFFTNTLRKIREKLRERKVRSREKV